ncbi:hypothetical protein SGGMMB4_04094 [Sodalis glossinidius str. 'morsitans']|uniref:HNH nuclease domain-containing protein n=1 Tax=Sodalis glossinidius (strain morsitans) TaxID=343509 RepID=Q2NS53_SODGM|nr:HNH endonuclease signature motif containing protein [Sodalis glossinidius]BAE75022.1 hypothetical protein SG1747 [Sodalis glossinidius str. 'morsitans']CRL45924.1 hypothetical protein SGGMMB4_04094 [Sodalis glossinidius str. 'morsitans']
MQLHYFICEKNKQEALTQYKDLLDNGVLHWEGEKKYFADKRIINAESENEKIHLFYREMHHYSFIYYGEIFLIGCKLRTEVPSQFIFKIGQGKLGLDLLDEIELHKNEFYSFSKTEKDAIIKSRIGQDFFRDGVINLWGCCAVTGLKNISFLRASHINPWKDFSNQERLDPMNGLLLQPMLDHLFDAGLITFSASGDVMFSPQLSQNDIQDLRLRRNLRLRKISNELEEYLTYHREKVFKHSCENLYRQP